MSQTVLILGATLLWGSLAAVLLAAPAVLPILLFDEYRSNRRRPRDLAKAHRTAFQRAPYISGYNLSMAGGSPPAVAFGSGSY